MFAIAVYVQCIGNNIVASCSTLPIVLFTRRVRVSQNGDQAYATLENSSTENNMVVGVHNIRENEPLILLEKQVSLHNEILFNGIVDNNQKPCKTSETVHDVVCGCVYLNILNLHGVSDCIFFFVFRKKIP